MTQDERELLISEKAAIEERLRKHIPNPKDMRRIDQIRSLLLTDGRSNDIRFKVRKPKESERVTSFTKDRR